MTFSIHGLVAEALSDPNVCKEAVDRYRETLKARKTVITSLEFAAKLNREIGLGADGQAPSVTFIFTSNLDPSKLRRPAKAVPKSAPA